MDKDNLKKEIIKEIGRIPKWKGSDNWSDVRSSRVFSQENSSDLYEGMQASRGLSIGPDLTFEDNINRVLEMVNSPLLPQDKERHEEIISNVDMAKIDSVLELGFRCPKILKIYKELGKKVSGVDVVKANCLIGQYLGYDCNVHDLRSDSTLDIKDNTLVISYHCFEHLPDPAKAIKKVKNSMGKNCYFQIEVPTESRVTPNYRNAHCFSFSTGSLKEILENYGFKILTSKEGENQRYLCEV